MAEPGKDLLLAFPKPGAAATDAEGDEGGGEYESEFDSAAVDAFPELADDPARLASFKQAVRLCVQEDRKKK